MTKNHETFLVLTEPEHDTIGELWRASEGTGRPLVKRYASIRSTMLLRIAERRGCATDAVPQTLEDQIAHIVLARAIEYNHLQGSITGELMKGIYYKGGGRGYLESFGRLCFCSAFHFKHPQPTNGHATDCDQLWEAYCRAADALLVREIEGVLLDGEHLCILDTTVCWSEQEECPPFEGDRALQRVVAEYLSLNEQDVQRVWLPVSRQSIVPWKPASTSTIAAALEKLQATLRQRGTSLFAKTAVLVVDDRTLATSMTVLTLGLRRLMGTVPIVLGVRFKDNRWQVVEPTPRVGKHEGN